MTAASGMAQSLGQLAVARMLDRLGRAAANYRMYLVVCNDTIEPQRGVFDDAFIDQLADRVTWAEQAGILVVVDMHQDLYGAPRRRRDRKTARACSLRSR
jgi:endoglycosylceramidase